MKIISKYKDYYDYLVGIYGEDEKVVYNRDSSVILEKALDPSSYSVFNPFNVFSRNREKDGRVINTGFVLLGNKIWDFEFYLDLSGNNIVKVEWVGPEEIEKRKSESPTYSWIVRSRYHSPDCPPLHYRNGELIDRDKVFKVHCKINDGSYSMNPLELSEEEKKTIPIIVCIENNYYINPILKNTPIEKFIPAEDAFVAIQDFISSLKDVEINDTRNDIQKLESAGFDKITSFRNPIIKCKKRKK